MHFIQEELWQEQLKKFHKAFNKNQKNVIVLPLFEYLDDIEIGNAIGGRAGINQLGTIYAWIPWFASKLESIIYSALL